MGSKKKRISIERRYELEKMLLSSKLNIDDLSNDELNYIKSSIKRPYEEFRKFIYLYDKSSPKLDEILFIEFLCGLYGSTRDEVIERIKEVRNLSRIQVAKEVEQFRNELKAVERRINIDIKNEENRK